MLLLICFESNDYSGILTVDGHKAFNFLALKCTSLVA